ncbi:MAG: zinc-dependent alcohol dehydrogenase family protein [Vulcanimicrobiaceae bacterium]
MRACVYHGPRDVRVETVPDPRIAAASDALVRITHACICGSDLWFYRGESAWQPGWRTGHEWLGIVEETGAEVRTLQRGDWVLAPFAYSDGSCEFCRAGIQTSCLHGGFWGGEDGDGGQAEAIRAPYADATLVRIPREVVGDEAMLAKILALTDVMGTGHHAARAAGVSPGTTAAVIGDGAVGLCAVLAAKRLGAERIIAFGRNPARTALARRFGASEIVSERGGAAVARALELTSGGAHAVLECVGSEEAMAMACGMARPGGAIGFVGVPHGSQTGVDLRRLFSDNIALRGGVAPVRAYIDELLADVLAGHLDPSPVFDLTVPLDGVPAGYAAMDGRSALKVMIRP